ncbi:MAG: TonB-dependent receptor [Bacteroidota bacterium]
MKYLFLLVLSISLQIAEAQSENCDQKVEGQIFDLITKDPLPYATIKVLGTDKGTVADENGVFRFEEVCGLEVDLEVRFIGFKTMVHHHDFHHGDAILYLATVDTELEGIVVENTKLSQIQSLAVQKKDIVKGTIATTSIGALSEELTGVSLLKTGSNVAKPIIHGLHSNRVLVINDGVRHAYQVWGLEHAPEIDPSHVDRIEIVKGAGTVKYGPEALGGVILYNSKRPTLDQPLTGSVTSAYQTNGRAGSGQINLGHGTERFAWNVGGFGIYQGDLEAPDYNLTNTGKREYGASFNTLYHRPIFDLQVSGSFFSQDIGILRASIVGNLTDLQNGIDNGEPVPTFDPTYSLQNPKQQTEHALVKSVFSLYLGEHTFNIQYAVQRNVRVEFDVRRGELNDRPVIDLEMWSHSVETEWIQPERGRWSGSSGIQLFTQSSVNEPGSNPVNFVPDYDVLNIGAFTIQALNFNNTTIEAGARFDYQSLSVADTIRERTIYANDVSFANATFTLGIRKQVNEKLSLFSNIGSAWRPPNVSELYSFGYHFSRLQFGMWRYDLEPTISTPPDRVFDQSLRPVPSEKSYKWVSGLDWTSNQVTAELIVYANQINDYIFLRPYGVTTGITGTFPFFIYDQTNAFFLGSDLDIR